MIKFYRTWIHWVDYIYTVSIFVEILMSLKASYFLASAHSICRQRIYNRLYECSCLIYNYVIFYVVIDDHLTLVYKSRNCNFVFLINVQNIYLDNYILCQNIIVVTNSLHTWNVYVTNNAFMKTWSWNTFICVNIFIDILNLVAAWLTHW